MTKVRIASIQDAYIQELIHNPSRVMINEIPKFSVAEMWKAVNDSKYTMAGVIDDKLVCLVGVHPSSILTNSCSVWMIAAAEINKHSFLFLRYGQRYLEILQTYHTDIYCMCHRRNGSRWLTMLGFEKIATFGDYYQYRLKRKNHG